jgi:ferredoxin
MARTIRIDEELCISCGMCINNLPDVFRYNASGKAECFDPEGAAEEDIQKDAIDACPVSCIHWQE